MARGIHTRPVNGHTNDWLTPPEIIKELGVFDTDPCAHPRQFYRTAKKMITPPADGLAVKWKGRVWLNPPYGSQQKHWLKRLADHGNGIALVPSRTEVESWFWPLIWERADAIFFMRGRLYFRRPDGSKAGNAGHGSVLAAYGEHSVEQLRIANLSGVFLERAKWEPDVAAERAATRITNDLFSNVNGEVAERLVLWQDNTQKDLGGLCWNAVHSRILKEFRALMDQALSVRANKE